MNSGAAIIANHGPAAPPGGVGSTVVGLSVFSNDDVATLPMIALPLAFGSESAVPPVAEVAFRVLSWAPEPIADGANVHTDIPLTGAHYQDHALAVGCSPALPAGVFPFATMAGVGVCRLSLLNMSGAPQVIPASTFKVFAVH